MNTADELEQFFLTQTIEDIVTWMQSEEYLPNEYSCEGCGNYCRKVRYKRSPDELAWRCQKKNCENFKKYISLRKNTFFEEFKISFAYIFRITIKYALKTPQHVIVRSLNISESIIKKVIKKIISKIPETDFSQHKLGGGNKIVQVDETMLNYKCKSHRGRSPENRTDSISIIEFENGIKRVYAQIIPNKRSETIIPIICRNVVYGAKIYTDEHRSYRCLQNYGFIHGTVCHKYEFINRIDNVDTQAVESFHSVLKTWIKSRKGVKTSNRADFLREFCFFYNNRESTLQKILDLLKIN